jgi:hypothetical protein
MSLDSDEGHFRPFRYAARMLCQSSGVATRQSTLRLLTLRRVDFIQFHQRLRSNGALPSRFEPRVGDVKVPFVREGIIIVPPQFIDGVLRRNILACTSVGDYRSCSCLRLQSCGCEQDVN